MTDQFGAEPRETIPTGVLFSPWCGKGWWLHPPRCVTGHAAKVEMSQNVISPGESQVGHLLLCDMAMGSLLVTGIQSVNMQTL